MFASSSSSSADLEQVDYMGNAPRQQNNLIQRLHQQQSQQQTVLPELPQNQEKKPNLEELMMKFVSTLKNMFQQTDTALRNQQAPIHNLENQIGQISKMLAERQPGMLPITTESNSREHIKAITLRSASQEGLEPEVTEPVRPKDKKKSLMREYHPPIPYPARLKQEKIDQQFGKFLDLFKQLRINIPFVEAISQMPKYVRFLKEILRNKRKLEDLGLMTLNEECSAILQNKLLVKRRDLGSFTVPCIISDLHISNALADLGASINLMPSSLFERLGLSKHKPTGMSIQLAERTMKYPRGIVKDVLVKGESSVPLILGRPFLATSRAVINVCDEKLQLRSLICKRILLDDPLQVALQAKDEEELSNKDVLEQLACLLASEPSNSANHFVDIDRSGVQKLRPSLEEPLALELKKMPKHLTYAYLDEAEKLPVIIAADLTPE
ncbi:uncharacterized protein LOC125368983 [Ricinus communis]|uniref:uncharacterized protein LOC125368983 n=1 Tax=Ricinus communis TaxID=3988 RepID=UPI00201AFD11|nr:uncharacterized protein LOC125368983 [Ricinus communis]